MRRPHPIPLLAGLACLLVFANGARAGVTIDVVFHDAYSFGDPGPGCVFTGYHGNSVSAGYCMDVIMRSTSELVGFSVSVQYDSDYGLVLASMYEWKGVGVSFNKAGSVAKSCLPTSGLADYGESIRSFDCIVEAPFNPPTLGAGTYRIGTLIWDTSAMTPGPMWIAAYIDDLVDGFMAVINGNVVDVSSEVVLNPASFPDPDPTPVPSISVGGYAVLFSGVMGIGLVLAARRRRPPRR